MDDEEFIRNTAGEMLATVGYTVGYANDDAEEIDQYIRARESGEPYDLCKVVQIVIRETYETG